MSAPSDPRGAVVIIRGYRNRTSGTYATHRATQSQQHSTVKEGGQND